jgi:caa(3)-type oxidase subunit IV
MSSRIIPVRAYVIVWVALLGLTALTIGLAFVPLGVWNAPIALGIAATKVLLVVWFFMHLRTSASATRLAALAALLWLSILLFGTLDDVMTRGWLPVPGK